MEVCRLSRHDIHEHDARPFLKVARAFSSERETRLTRLSVSWTDQFDRAYYSRQAPCREDQYLDGVPCGVGSSGAELFHEEVLRNDVRKSIRQARGPVGQERLPRTLRVERLVKVIEQWHRRSPPG